MVQVIETDETGQLLLSPPLLGEARPHSRYTVETAGGRLIVEAEEALLQRQAAYEEWKCEWNALTDQITDAWHTGKSAAEIISEMRR